MAGGWSLEPQKDTNEPPSKVPKKIENQASLERFGESIDPKKKSHGLV